MKQLQQRAEEILNEGKAKIIIGYTSSVENKVKPYFITDSKDAANLIFDMRCVKNLATFLNRKEIKSIGKIGIVANIDTLRSVMQLYSEHQLEGIDLTILYISEEGEMTEFESLAKAEELLVGKKFIHKELSEQTKSVEDMPREEKWEFWTKELSNCIKCYACRQACPMCYCTTCMTENNMPQWVSIPSFGHSNMEWHILRAMHLAGRCVDCGECARACPMDIPLNLLTYKLNDMIHNKFGHQAGITQKTDYVLSQYKTEDKENFIR